MEPQSIFGEALTAPWVISAVYVTTLSAVFALRGALSGVVLSGSRFVFVSTVKNFLSPEAHRPLHAALVVGVVCIAFSLLLYSPPLWIDQFGGRFEKIALQATDPFGVRFEGEPFLAYRILLPSVAHVLGLRGEAIAIIPIIANVLTFSLIFDIGRKHYDAWTAFLLCLGLAVTQVGQVGNTWIGFPDPITNLLIAIGLWKPRPAVLFLVTALGGLNDERFFLGLPFVVLWAWDGDREWRSLLTMAGAGLLGFVAVLLVRHGIAVGWLGPPVQEGQLGSSTGAGRLSLTISSLLAPLSTFRGMWVVVVAALLPRAARNAVIEVVFVVVLMATVLVATFPGDLSRSAASIYPAFLLATRWLYERDARQTQSILLLGIVFCVFIPMGQLSSGTSWFHWVYPLPLSALRAMF